MKGKRERENQQGRWKVDGRDRDGLKDGRMLSHGRSKKRQRGAGDSSREEMEERESWGGRKKREERPLSLSLEEIRN